MQMCEDEEARARTRAGSDSHKHAATAEVASSRSGEGGASSSLAPHPSRWAILHKRPATLQISFVCSLPFWAVIHLVGA